MRHYSTAIARLSSLVSHTQPAHGMVSPRRPSVNASTQWSTALDALDTAHRIHQSLVTCAMTRTMSCSARRLSGRTTYILPPTSASSQRYNLRQRPHLLQLPEHMTQLSDGSFLIRMLYKDTYWLSFSFLFSCLFYIVMACVMSCLIKRRLIDWLSMICTTLNDFKTKIKLQLEPETQI